MIQVRRNSEGWLAVNSPSSLHAMSYFSLIQIFVKRCVASCIIEYADFNSVGGVIPTVTVILSAIVHKFK